MMRLILLFVSHGRCVRIRWKPCIRYVDLLLSERRTADAVLVAETAGKMPSDKGRDGGTNCARSDHAIGTNPKSIGINLITSEKR